MCPLVRCSTAHTYLSKAVRSLPLLDLVAIVPLLLRVSLLVRGGLQSARLERDVGPLGVEVGQGHQVNQDSDSVGVEEELHILSVVEEFVHKLEEAVSLCPVLTLSGRRRGRRRRRGEFRMCVVCLHN